MDVERVAFYRRKASELMARAEEMKSPEIGTELRALALQWLLLAERVDRDQPRGTHLWWPKRSTGSSGTMPLAKLI